MFLMITMKNEFLKVIMTKTKFKKILGTKIIFKFFFLNEGPYLKLILVDLSHLILSH